MHVLWADDKKPAGGIRCRVVPASEINPDLHAQRFVTAPDGTFRVDQVRSGRVDLQFDAGASATAQVKPASDNETFVELQPGCIVEGVVVEQEGKPVAGAGLYVGFHDGWIYAPGATFEDPPTAKTGEDGTFQFHLAREEKFAKEWIGARAEGFAPTPLQFIIARRGAVFRLRFTLGGPGGEVIGQVLTPSGRGVTGARVVAGNTISHGSRLTDGTLVIDRDLFGVATDAAGSFRIAGIRPGSTTVNVRAPGFPLWSGSVDVVAGAPATPLEIRLALGGSIAGTVVDAQGTRVAGAEVRTAEPLGGIGVSTTFTAATGSFRLDGVPAGKAGLSAFAEGVGMAVVNLEVAAGEEVHWDAVLSLGLELTGRVVDSSDSALPGWSLQGFALGGDVANAPPQVHVREAISDASGRFALRHVADTAYRINVYTPASHCFVPEAMLDGVRPGKELVIRIQPQWIPSAFVTGIVVDGDDRPVGSAVVQLWWSTMMGRGGMALTEEGTGRFRIGPVTSKPYGVDIETRGYAPLRIEPRPMEAGGTLDFGTLRLGRPGYLTAKLRRDDGGSLADLHAEVLGLRPYADQVNVEGEVARATLPAGKYRLLISSGEVAGCETAFDIRAGEETILSIALKAGVEKTVTFIAPNDVAHPLWLHCVLRDASGRVLRESDNQVFVQGRFWWYPKLALGTYQVEARTDTGLMVTGSLTVRDLVPSEEPIEFSSSDLGDLR